MQRSIVALLIVLLSVIAGCGDGSATETPRPPQVQVGTTVQGTIVSWEEIDGAISYNLYVEEVAGELSTLSEDDKMINPNAADVFSDVTSPFELNDHRTCDTTYLVAVTAVNEYGESEVVTGGRFGPAPTSCVEP